MVKKNRRVFTVMALLGHRMFLMPNQMAKKRANTNPIKNVSQNRIFSPLRVGSKTIKN
jgi:hypothetical protein